MPDRTPDPIIPFASAPAHRKGNNSEKLNVVCVGAHPDDPETGCGGTLARLAANGHHVAIVYLTRGEAGARGSNVDDIGRIRTSEALDASHLLHVEAHFAGQVDGQTDSSEHACRHFADLLLRLKPDIVFTHWPVDTHADHRNAAHLTYQAWQWAAESFALAYYEVMTGIQTQQFQPNFFVDISGTHHRKRAAIYAHVSQNPDRFYPHHEEMERQRGAEGRYTRAEAFFLVPPSAKGTQPCRPTHDEPVDTGAPGVTVLRAFLEAQRSRNVACKIEPGFSTALSIAVPAPLEPDSKRPAKRP